VAEITQIMKGLLLPKIREVLKKYDAIGYTSIKNYTTLVVKVTDSPIKFSLSPNGCKIINAVCSRGSDEEKAFTSELLAAMNGCGNLQNGMNVDGIRLPKKWKNQIHIGDFSTPYRQLLKQPNGIMGSNRPIYTFTKLY
jgi:hypothetical protein